MKLTRTERWVLSNQYQILAALSTEDAEHYHQCREILEQGYELEYDEIARHVYDGDDTMSIAECREVVDTLAMFHILQRTYRDLADKSGIDESRLEFGGFDGNHETKHVAYARFYASQQGGRFTDLPHPEDFNSHYPTLDVYRRMLAEWHRSESKYKLTRDDVVRITNAGHASGSH